MQNEQIGRNTISFHSSGFLIVYCSSWFGLPVAYCCFFIFVLSLCPTVLMMLLLYCMFLWAIFNIVYNDMVYCSQLFSWLLLFFRPVGWSLKCMRQANQSFMVVLKTWINLSLSCSLTRSLSRLRMCTCWNLDIKRSLQAGGRFLCVLWNIILPAPLTKTSLPCPLTNWTKQANTQALS